MILSLLALLAQIVTSPPPLVTSAIAPSTSRPFTALHTYFISPTGNDGNSGTDAAHPWLTPAHAMVCGDVLIAAPGTYSGVVFSGTFTSQPTNCPSTSGGIDGVGGIWFVIVLCGGTELGGGIGVGNGCAIQGTANTSGFYSVEFDEGQNNWAFEGFYFDTGCVNTGAPGNCSRSFGTRNCTATQTHHIALINSITANSMQGFAGNDCGGAGGTATRLQDYLAAVGNLMWNSAQNGDYQGSICIGAIDFTNLGNHDTVAGTHNFMYNNYGIKNQSPACVSLYDGHAFYIDSPDAHIYTQKAVIANNIGYLSTRACIALTYGAQTTTAGATFNVYNNTCFNNAVLGAGAPENTGDFGEMNLNTGNDNAPWNVLVIKNISFNSVGVTAQGAHTYAWDLWKSIPGASSGSLAFGVVGSENVWRAPVGVCGFNCDPGNNVEFNDQAYLAAYNTTNFYQDPNFNNTADLVNHQGKPNCTGFVTTTACQGYNANTSTLTANTFIYDLQPSAAGSCMTGGHCVGKGFQLPSTTCSSNSQLVTDTPIWLKGIVYLHWNGSSLTQNLDLATAPCYVGPGDLVAGATAWWSCTRAYSAAQTNGTTPACRVSRASDGHVCDFLLATTGWVNTTANCSVPADNGQTPAAFCNATTCSVVEAYDQTGNGTLMQQSGSIALPTLQFSCIGALPCMSGNGSQMLANTTLNGPNQPFTQSLVINASAVAGSGYGTSFACQNGLIQTGWTTIAPPNGAALYAGTIQSIASTFGTWYSWQDVYNGASSTISQNGTRTTVAGSPGTNSCAGTTGPDRIALFAFNSSGAAGNAITAKIGEAGIWPGAMSTANQDLLTTNQRNFWGF